MGQRVKRFRTNVSEAQMAQAINQAWTDMFGKEPTKNQVALIMAQNALETNHRKSMWNNNIGNITTDGSTSDYYDDLTTDEQLSPGVWTKKNLKYKSYKSLEDGVKDYLQLLHTPRYHGVWNSLLKADPVAFSKGLKSAGYYTANEAPYTRSISKLYSQFANTPKYKDVPESHTDQRVAGKFDFITNLLNQLGGKVKSMPSANIDSLLNGYLQQVLASEKQNKKIYKKFLPKNYAVIQVFADDYTDAIEFGRILSLAMEEELLANAFIHTDGKSIEIEICVPGPSSEIFKAASQLITGISEAFCDATKKIGGVKIKTQLITNKKSSYQPIRLKAAEIQHRKFLLKFT